MGDQYVLVTVVHHRGALGANEAMYLSVIDVTNGTCNVLERDEEEK